jgi:hypothetical protein
MALDVAFQVVDNGFDGLDDAALDPLALQRRRADQQGTHDQQQRSGDEQCKQQQVKGSRTSRWPAGGVVGLRFHVQGVPAGGSFLPRASSRPARRVAAS